VTPSELPLRLLRQLRFVHPSFKNESIGAARSKIRFCEATVRVKLAPNRLNAISCGGIAGFLAGLIGTGGATRGLVLAGFDLEKNVFVATSAAIDSGVDFSRMIVYLRNGYLAPEFYWFVPGLFVMAFTGSYVGKVLLNKIQQKSFRKIVLLLIFVIGLTTLGRFVQQFMR
jgi:uncharacterized membrane protein YfcA